MGRWHLRLWWWQPDCRVRASRRATVTVTIVATVMVILACGGGTTTVATPPAPYDLVGGVWDGYNGISVNPQWQSNVQAVDAQGVRPPTPSMCGGRPWLAPCTTQHPAIDDPGRYSLTDTICGQGGGLTHGHANWRVAAYTGRIYWESHSSPVGNDDDYSLDLFNPWGAGSTLTDGGRIHVEFNSHETIDRFATSWWQAFHSAVDQGDDQAHAMIDHKDVMVIGVMGLDFVHGDGGAELHPTYAMAVHVKDDPNDDEWAFFARNWGDEGFCSDGGSVLWNTQSIFLQLTRPGATAYTVTQYELASAQQASAKTFSMQNGAAVGIRLDFPPPDVNNEQLYDGDIHLKWTVPNVPVATPTPPISCIEQNGGARADIEATTDALVQMMTPGQRAAYEAMLPVVAPAALNSATVSLEHVDTPPPIYPPPSESHASGGPKPPTIAVMADPERVAQQEQSAHALLAAFGGQWPSGFRWPGVEAMPGLIVFAGEPGSPAEKVCISSVGTADVHLGQMTITGPDAADFTITANDCPAVLASGARCHVLISFTARGQGDRTATLNIADDAGDSPQTVMLDGPGFIG